MSVETQAPTSAQVVSGGLQDLGQQRMNLPEASESKNSAQQLKAEEERNRIAKFNARIQEIVASQCMRYADGTRRAGEM